MLSKRCKQLSVALICLTPAFLLGGCAKKDRNLATTVSASQPNLSQQIRHNGAQIVQQGSRLQIILPTDKFFRLQSTEVMAHQTGTLQSIATYLKHFLASHHVKRVITVTGYTDTVFSKQERQKLSQQYAEVIASYLWNQGFSREQLRVRGLGAKNTVGDPNTTAGSADNRRVVIQVN